MPGRQDYPGAGRFVPGGRVSLATVARAAHRCQGCDLYERASQTVFGKGAARPAAVLIGEQPGDCGACSAACCWRTKPVPASIAATKVMAMFMSVSLSSVSRRRSSSMVTHPLPGIRQICLRPGSED